MTADDEGVVVRRLALLRAGSAFPPLALSKEKIDGIASSLRVL